MYPNLKWCNKFESTINPKILCHVSEKTKFWIILRSAPKTADFTSYTRNDPVKLLNNFGKHLESADFEQRIYHDFSGQVFERFWKHHKNPKLLQYIRNTPVELMYNCEKPLKIRIFYVIDRRIFSYPIRRKNWASYAATIARKCFLRPFCHSSVISSDTGPKTPTHKN